MSSPSLPASLISQTRWALRHAWQGPADRHALGLCRTALRDLGIDLVDAAAATESPAAVKYHAMEMVDAVALDPHALLDLRPVAHAAQWHRRLPTFVQRSMVHGERWHGIPLGVHRANAAWVNEAYARKVGAAVPVSLAQFVAWLEQVKAHVAWPLAIGSESWQIGVLFESIMLALAGATSYRRAFVQHDPAVWSEPAPVEALRTLQQFRRFVDEDALNLPWVEQLSRVRRGEAAVQVMGDWVRATDCTGLREWAVPGTTAWFVAIVDFVVPLAGSPQSLSYPAAAALTAAPFQYSFAMAKGCMPAVQDAWGVIDPKRARGIDIEMMILPSLTFDQCCSVARKNALLSVVAECFCDGRSVSDCSRTLAEMAHAALDQRKGCS